MKIDDYKMDLKILLNCTFGSASFLLSAYTIFALADFFSYNAADAADIPENGKKYRVVFLTGPPLNLLSVGQ